MEKGEIFDDELDFDPDELVAKSQTHWTHYWQETSMTRKGLIGNGLIDFFKQFIHLPHEEIQLPIALALGLQNQKYSDVLGYLFNWGKPGSGKSEFAELLALLHNTSSIGGLSYASLRNHVNSGKWRIPPDQWNGEKPNRKIENDGCLVVLDNLGHDHLGRQSELYELILVAYKRTAKVIRASGKRTGENFEFFPFSLYVFTSVHYIPGLPDMTELARRIFTIKFERSDKELVKRSTVDFSNFHDLYFDFWKRKSNVQKYLKHFKEISASKAINDAALREVSTPMLATGLATGIWENLDSTFEAFHDYQEFWKNSQDLLDTATLQALQGYLENELQEHYKLKEKAKQNNLDLETLGICEKASLDAQNLGEWLKVQKNNYALDPDFRNEQLSQYMNKLGFKLTHKQGRSLWVEI